MTATAASNNNAALADQYWTTGDEIHDTKANHDLPIEKIWTDRQFTSRLVNPANRRKMTVIIVGTGLAGGAAAATLGEAGYRVENFCYQDSPRRAHSTAAPGGDSPREVFSGGTSATVLGIVLFIAALSFIYRWTARKVQVPEK